MAANCFPLPAPVLANLLKAAEAFEFVTADMNGEDDVRPRKVGLAIPDSRTAACPGRAGRAGGSNDLKELEVNGADNLRIILGLGGTTGGDECDITPSPDLLSFELDLAIAASKGKEVLEDLAERVPLLVFRYMCIVGGALIGGAGNRTVVDMYVRLRKLALGLAKLLYFKASDSLSVAVCCSECLLAVCCQKL